MKKRQKIWRKRGPKTPTGGRIRFTVNLPRTMLKFVDSLSGRSRSDKIVNALSVMEGKKTR